MPQKQPPARIAVSVLGVTGTSAVTAVLTAREVGFCFKSSELSVLGSFIGIKVRVGTFVSCAVRILVERWVVEPVVSGLI